MSTNQHAHVGRPPEPDTTCQLWSKPCFHGSNKDRNSKAAFSVTVLLNVVFLINKTSAVLVCVISKSQMDTVCLWVLMQDYFWSRLIHWKVPTWLKTLVWIRHEKIYLVILKICKVLILGFINYAVLWNVECGSLASVLMHLNTMGTKESHHLQDKLERLTAVKYMHRHKLRVEGRRLHIYA